MEALQHLFVFLIEVSLALMVIGLFKPQWVLPRAFNPTSGKAIAVYIALLIVSAVAGSLLHNVAESERMKDPAYAARKKQEAEEEAAQEAAQKEGQARGAQRITALVMSQKFVRKRLKAPASADFPYITDSDVSVASLGDDRYTVSAYVDAQNSFGAKIRTHYVCVLRNTAGDTWVLETLTLQ